MTMFDLFKKRPSRVNLRPTEEKKGNIFLWLTFLLLFLLLLKEFGFGAGTLLSYVKKDSNETVIEKVALLFDVPSGETPTIATVTDVKLLEGQPFFQNAQNGDRVLVFKDMKRVVLYRPSINKIIEIMPLEGSDVGGPQQN